VISQINHFLGHMRRTALLRERSGLTDGQLLELFIVYHEEEAFAALIRRHGPMVLGVCQRVLRHLQDAEDAFQATFLVLARKAPSVVPGDRVGNWLYGVAYRTALKARTAAARRRQMERRAISARGPASGAEAIANDWLAVLDEELRRLPAKYRDPIVLCLLEGKTRKEAALSLGWTAGTLSGQLARAKEMLARRLRRRGVALSAAAVAAALMEGAATAKVPVVLMNATAQVALASAGAAAGHSLSVPVIALGKEVLKAMLISKLKVAVGIVGFVLALTFGVGAAAWQRGSESRGNLPVAPEPPEKVPAAPDTNKNKLPDYIIEPPDVLLVKYSDPLPPGTDPEKTFGTCLVRPDGTIALGSLGSVSIAGRTLKQAHTDIAKHLKNQLDSFNPRKLTVEVLAFNSKFYYVIFDDDQGGDQVYRVPATGNETVQDAISQVKGLAQKAARKQVWITRRLGAEGNREQILKVDWLAITREGAVATNYQLLPGDRVFCKSASGEVETAELQAEKDVAVAAFYQRTGHPASALFYYEMVRQRYPGTTWSAKARQAISELQTEMLPRPSVPRKAPPAKIGRIRIVGSSRTPDEVILWALPLSPGDPFKEADLREAEQALARVSRCLPDPRKHFRAQVTLDDQHSGSGTVDILITIKE
jgi:polysaccharide biosynthesis/export protein